MNDNGMERFVYIKDGIFELGYIDQVKSRTGAAPTVLSYEFILFGVLCLVILLVKLIVFIVIKVRKSDKKYAFSDKLILAQQSIYGVSGIIFLLFINIVSAVPSPAFLTVSAILAAVLGICSLANGCALCYNTVKGDVRIRTKIKQYIWAALCIAHAVFIVVMQLYCFWKL